MFYLLLTKKKKTVILVVNDRSNIQPISVFCNSFALNNAFKWKNSNFSKIGYRVIEYDLLFNK